MIQVYRITHKKWSDKLKASGYAARWNSNGFFMIYAAENHSLACLENLVHRNGFGVDNDFSVMTISIPKGIKLSEIKASELPFDWNLNEETSYLMNQNIGNNWLKNQNTCVLFVPSAIIENERNILINPNHKDFDKIKLITTQDFRFDNRFSK